jgi:hypothetical protein
MPNWHRFSQNNLVKSAFNGALANSTQNGAGIDCLGYRRGAFLISATTGASTTFNYTVQDSADNSSWNTALSGVTLASAQAASTSNAAYVVDLDLSKLNRYVRLNVVGTGTAGQVGALLVLGEGILAAPTQDNAVTNN